MGFNSGFKGLISRHCIPFLTLVARKMTNFRMILLSLFVSSDLSFIVLHLLSPFFVSEFYQLITKAVIL